MQLGKACQKPKRHRIACRDIVVEKVEKDNSGSAEKKRNLAMFEGENSTCNTFSSEKWDEMYKDSPPTSKRFIALSSPHSNHGRGGWRG